MSSFENKGSMPVSVLVTSGDDLRGNIICSGAADQVEINLAFGYLTSGRTNKQVVKLIGTFVLSASIDLPSYTILDLTEATISTSDDTINFIRVDGGSGTEIVFWEVRGGKLVGSGNTNMGIFPDECDDWVVNGVMMENMGTGGMNPQNCNRFKILNCEMGLHTKLGGYGVWVQDGFNYQIIGNRINSTGMCLGIGSGDEISSDILVAHNDLWGWSQTSEHGIYVTARQNAGGPHGNVRVVLDGNMVHDDAGDGGTAIEIRSPDVACVNNMIFNVSTYGIHVKSQADDLCSQVTVANNILYNDETTSAIVLDATVATNYMRLCSVHGNIITGWAKGIWLLGDYCQFNTVSNNMIMLAEAAAGAQIGIHLTGGTTSNTIVHNTVYNLFGGAIFEQSTGNYFRENKCFNSSFNPLGNTATSWDNTNPPTTFGVPGGGAAGPTVANADYVCLGVDCILDISGGTAVVVTLKDPAGVAISVLGAPPVQALWVPVDFIVEFGNFSAPPTVVVSRN